MTRPRPLGPRDDLADTVRVVGEFGVIARVLARSGSARVAEVVEAAVEVVEADPSVGAFLLECSDLPPYARSVREATGRPVFDWAGFIRYVHDAVEPRTYHGSY